MELKSGEEVILKTQIGCHFLKDIMFRGRGAYLIESCVIVPYFPNLYEIMKSDKEWGHLSLTWKALSCRLCLSQVTGNIGHHLLDRVLMKPSVVKIFQLDVRCGSQGLAVFWCHPKISQCTCQVVLVVKNLPASAGRIRCEFHPWVRKIPWSRKWQPILVYLPGEPQPWLDSYAYIP